MNTMSFVSLAVLVAGCLAAEASGSREDFEVVFGKLKDRLLALEMMGVPGNDFQHDNVKNLHELHVMSQNAAKCAKESQEFWLEKGFASIAASKEADTECKRLKVLIEYLKRLDAFLKPRTSVTSEQLLKIDSALCNAEKCRHRLRLILLSACEEDPLSEEVLHIDVLKSAIESAERAVRRISGEKSPEFSRRFRLGEEVTRAFEKHSKSKSYAKGARRTNTNAYQKLEDVVSSSSASSSYDSGSECEQRPFAYSLGEKSKRESAY